MTAWWLPDDFLMTAWWLTAWWLTYNSLTTAWWLPYNCLHDCLTTVGWHSDSWPLSYKLLNVCLMSISWLPDDCLMTVRWLPDNSFPSSDRQDDNDDKLCHAATWKVTLGFRPTVRSTLSNSNAIYYSGCQFENTGPKPFLKLSQFHEFQVSLVRIKKYWHLYHISIYRLALQICRIWPFWNA